MTRIAILLVAVSLTLPTLAALPAPSTPVVLPGTIGAGQTREYRDGTFLVVGDVTVANGGTLVFENADVLFAGGDWVITVRPGGTLRSIETTMRPDPTAEVDPGLIDRAFRVEVEPGAALTLTDTVVDDGYGVDVRTSLATIERVTFVGNDVGLALHDVDLAVSELNFTQNLRGLTAEGGSVEIVDSVFDRNRFHIETEDTDVTLLDSAVYAGEKGLRGIRGAFDVQRNTFAEHMGPDTVAVWLTQATSALLVDNTITDWETGIMLDDTSATISRGSFASSQWSDHVTASSFGPDLAWSVDNSSFANGRVTFWGICCDDYGSTARVENSTFDEGDLMAAWVDSTIAYNTLDATRIHPVGPLHVHHNTLTGVTMGIQASAPSLAEGSVHDNDVDGDAAEFPVCYQLLNVRSERNAARECSTAFDLFGEIVSTDDAAVDPAGPIIALSIAFDINDADAQITRATAEGYGWGIILREGGATVSDATVRDARLGIYVESGTTGTTIEDSLLEGNEDAVQTGGALAFDGNRVFDSADDGLNVISGTVSGTQNWFEGNADLAVRASAGVTLTQSYWGAASGPTVSTNPTGTGDAISESVAYAPFLTSPPS